MGDIDSWHDDPLALVLLRASSRYIVEGLKTLALWHAFSEYIVEGFK